METNKPLLGMSSCLLGEKVRYDGAHKYDEWINTELKKYFEFVSICPEMLMGMGAPRPTIRLVRDPANQEVKLLSHDGNKDLTELARLTNQKILSELPNISGYILMKKSPSCGVERIKVYRLTNEMSESKLRNGFFAEDLIKSHPLLPIIDSGRLFDAHERDNFLRRVMAYHRFQLLDGSIKSLQDFHARYKFLLYEYNQDKVRKLGKLAANSELLSSEDVYHAYFELFFQTTALLPTIKNQVNTFQHLVGYFKNNLSGEEKTLFHELVRDFQAKILPYQVPLKMIYFFIKKYQQFYLLNQYYLDPYPKDLMPKI